MILYLPYTTSGIGGWTDRKVIGNEIFRNNVIRQHNVQVGASHRTDSNRTDTVLACEKRGSEVMPLQGSTRRFKGIA